MDETVQKNYKVLLDGTSDQEAVYYLMDVTGNGSPELIVGKEAMSVYSCNQGAVTTIGAMAIDTAYLSTKYGFLAFNNQNDKYELVQYKYDGEMITETVLVSASSEADYKSQADQYLADARELKAYALDDRTPFGDEAAEQIAVLEDNKQSICQYKKVLTNALKVCMIYSNEYGACLGKRIMKAIDFYCF